MIVEATRQAEDERWQRAAWVVAHLLAPFSATPLSPQALLTPVDPVAAQELFNVAAGLMDPVDLALAKQRARG